MKPGWVTANNFQLVSSEDHGWKSLRRGHEFHLFRWIIGSDSNENRYLVKTSNSNIDTWLLLVRSMVFCSAVASLMLWIGCTRFSLSLNSSQGTIVLKREVVWISLSLSSEAIALLTARWNCFSRNPLLPAWSAGISLLRRFPCWTRISTRPDCERSTTRV